MPIDLAQCEGDARDEIISLLRAPDFKAVFTMIWNGDNPPIVIVAPTPSLKRMAMVLREVADDYEKAEQ